MVRLFAAFRVCVVTGGGSATGSFANGEDDTKITEIKVKL